MAKQSKKIEVVSVKTAKDFRGYVWPKIKDALGGGQLFSVEGSEFDQFKFHLDRVAGVDAWQVNDEASIMRGLACRVQYVEKPFPTFTVRKSSSSTLTEYDKRVLAIQRGGLFPELTIQAYLSDYMREVLGVYVCRTRDLIDTCKNHPGVPVVRNHVDGNEFFSVHWKHLLNQGFPVFITGASVIHLDAEFKI